MAQGSFGINSHEVKKIHGEDSGQFEQEFRTLKT